MNCLKCGKTITEVVCGSCGYDSSRGFVSAFAITIPTERIPKHSVTVRTNNVLMSDKSYKDRVFGSDYTRKQIKTVTFLDTLAEQPRDAWDVSEARDRSVMAWVRSKGKRYDLYIGADGGVTAPDNCAHLFAGYDHVKVIDVNGIFDTTRVTDMSYMFYRCNALESLDVSGFDTARVTNMSYMFGNCRRLKSLDVSGFDTARVTNMSHMFGSCRRLKSLDMSGFSTAKVTDMSEMFRNCKAMTTLDLNSFDISKVSYLDLMFMFDGCKKLTTLHVNNWSNTVRVSTYGMFYGCGLPQDVISAILRSLGKERIGLSDFVDIDFIKTILVMICVILSVVVPWFLNCSWWICLGIAMGWSLIFTVFVEGFDFFDVRWQEAMLAYCIVIPGISALVIAVIEGIMLLGKWMFSFASY